ncbi:hypothetical protein HAX54_022994 [Datura stramonium]|uniref:Uncharacterized protein n=1 Tax=Datura stramonium TaxID=4076 RepID=A0ABS8UW66_DATST|nr:hypothetical protein [Datura stramonium]
MFPGSSESGGFPASFLSLARVTLDAHFVITNNEHLGIADYVDILGLIASVCLLGIPIRGKTGIPYGKKPTFLQQITFSWLNPLFEVGVKKPIDQDEVPDVDLRDSAKFLSDSFDESLKIILCWSIPYPRLCKLPQRKEISGVTKWLSSSTSFSRCKMVEIIAQRQWIFGARQLGLRLRARSDISHLSKGPTFIKSITPKLHQRRDNELHERRCPKYAILRRYLNTIYDAYPDNIIIGNLYFTHESRDGGTCGIRGNFGSDDWATYP